MMWIKFRQNLNNKKNINKFGYIKKKIVFLWLNI